MDGVAGVWCPDDGDWRHRGQHSRFARRPSVRDGVEEQRGCCGGVDSVSLHWFAGCDGSVIRKIDRKVVNTVDSRGSHLGVCDVDYRV